MPMELLVYAHLGHYLWVMYIPPVLIVVFAIVKTSLSERRAARKDGSGEGEDPAA